MLYRWFYCHPTPSYLRLLLLLEREETAGHSGDSDRRCGEWFIVGPTKTAGHAGDRVLYRWFYCHPTPACLRLFLLLGRERTASHAGDRDRRCGTCPIDPQSFYPEAAKRASLSLVCLLPMGQGRLVAWIGRMAYVGRA